MDNTPVSDAPTELRTFLVADIRGYTRFTDQRGDEAAGRLAAKFAQLAREAAEAHAGRVLELRGDEALAVFGSARQALRAAVDLRQRCQSATEEDPSLPLTIGAGLDAGEAVPVEGGYRGAALNLAARLCAIAVPGQVLVGEGLVHLARKTEGLSFVELPSRTLKGFDAPIRVFEVLPEGAEAVWLPTADMGTTLPGTQAGTNSAAPVVPASPMEHMREIMRTAVDPSVQSSSRELTDAINAAVNERLTRTAAEIRARTEQRMRGETPYASPPPPPARRGIPRALSILILVVILVVIVLFVTHVL
jgi:class 3 adenylate cyclase